MKLLLPLALTFGLNAFALSPENILQNDLLKIESFLLKAGADASLSDQVSFEKFLLDPSSKISAEFKIPPYFNDSVRFWFNIYTRYKVTDSVLHDKENLAIVYESLSFDSLSGADVSPFVRTALQSKFVSDKVKGYRQAFKNLGMSKNEKGQTEAKILAALTRSDIKIPKSKKARVKFFNELSSNFRAQTGQYDNIKQGIKNYLLYEEFIEQVFQNFELPHELIAISFLESSFNTKAKSRVGATGVWQFMQRTGKSFMDIDRYQDGRLNPLLSSISALHLLAQNYKILDRWDLAVPAYNSGTRHILKAKRKLKKSNMSLQDMLTGYDHPHVGFASKNFFSEFLALVHALAYKSEIYFDSKISEYNPDTTIVAKDIKAYVTICPLKPSKFYSIMEKSAPHIDRINSHILKRGENTTFKPGLILFSDRKLTDRRYYQVDFKEMRRNYPKNWTRFLKNQSCSKR